MPDIVVVGEILVEIIAEKPDQAFTKPGKLNGPFPSGAPAIFADQAGKFGASCGIIAKIGADDFGVLNLERLRADGVDVSHVVTDAEHTTGTAFVTYYSDGGRRFIYHFRDSAAGHLTADDIDPVYIKNAKTLHVMGCSLLAGPNLAGAVMRAVDIARENGVAVSFDPNLRPELLKNEFVREAFHKILSAATVILTGKSELSALTGCGDCKTAVESLKAGGAKIVAVKNGGKDTLIATKDAEYTIPAFQAEEVDPTGAGDCYDAVFISCLLEGLPIDRAGELAAAAGACAVMKKGPMEGASSKEQLLEFIRESGRR